MARLVARRGGVAKRFRAAYPAAMRFLMACLILLLAAPAAAMPACAPPAAREHHGHHAPEAPAPPAMPDHGCIGCATPMRAPLAMNDRAAPPRAAQQRPIDLRIPEGATLRPALPPPRMPA